MELVLSFLIEHWASISAVVAAVGLRLFPTEKNYDIFSKILKILDLIVPNIKKGGGRHAAKILLFFVLALGYENSYAQLNTTTRLLKFRTGVQHAVDTAEANGNEGNIWYDYVTGRYRANEGGTNKFLIGAGGGGNFWPLSGSANFAGDVNIEDNGTQTAIRLGSLFDPIESYTAFTTDGFNVSSTTSSFDMLAGSINMATSGAKNLTVVYDGAGVMSHTISGGGNTTELALNSDGFSLLTDGTGISTPGGVLTVNRTTDIHAPTTIRTDENGQIQLLLNDATFDSRHEFLMQGFTATVQMSSFGNISSPGSEVGGQIFVNLDGSTITSINGGVVNAQIEVKSANNEIELEGNINLTPTSSASELYDNVYSPTGTCVSNCVSASFVSNCVYTRTGNNVTVSGIVVTDGTAAGSEMTFRVNLPIASNIGGTVDATGTFSGRDNDGTPITYATGMIVGDATNDAALFSFVPTSTDPAGMSFVFQYRIK